MYKVTITRNEIEEVVKGKTWERIDSEGSKANFGYTPEVTTKETVERKIYEQIVDDLDIIKVIEAVNKEAE